MITSVRVYVYPYIFCLTFFLDENCQTQFEPVSIYMYYAIRNVYNHITDCFESISHYYTLVEDFATMT